MPTPLLTTKLYIPPVRPELVPRPRLIERLNTGLHRKLTLISAPAGFGKTTLLSEWAGNCGRPVAWLSLDEGDNDPARFLAHFVAARQTIAPHIAAQAANIGESVLSAFRAPQPPPIESVLTGLINEIAAVQEHPSTSSGQAPSTVLRQGSERSFVLVLDDYHLITAQPIHDALTFLLDHLPGNMHLVIATRSDPPLHLARLRVRGQLTELRSTDLRFTPDEVTEFLNQVMGLELAADDVAALASRTEGWIAGLQLAALSMRGRADVAGFIAAFSGSHRHVVDYLAEEVIAQQSDEIHDFLCQTAILDRLTAPLCDAATGRKNSQAVLRQLEQANLFLVPLDDQREWYRYHHLFADALRNHLHQDHPDQVTELHRRATEWYERNGLATEAVRHALAAADFERAANLIEQAAEPTLMRSEIATFLSWVEALPDDVMRARPLLCVFHAMALLLSSRPLDTVEARLQDAIEGDTASPVSGEVAAIRGLIAALRGETRHSTELSHRALELLPAESLFLRSIVAWNLGMSYSVSGDVVAAIQTFDEAARTSQKAGNLMTAVVALSTVAELCMRMQGQLDKAKAVYEQALELAADEQGQPLPVAGIALMGLGELLRERNDLETSARHLVEGIELIKRWGEIGALDGYVALALVKQAQGDLEGAREAIHKAQQLAIKFDVSEMDDILVAAYQVRLWVAQGNLEAAIRWVEERGLAPSEAEGEGLDGDVGLDELEGAGGVSSVYLLRELEHIALARVYIAQGRPDEALEVLKPLLPAAERQGRMRSVIEMLVLRALAFQSQGDVAQAMTSLEYALSLAEPEGYVRIFVDEGEPMAALLRQAASRGITPDYVGKLLAAFGGEAKDQGRRTKETISSFVVRHSSLIEPLSNRELEVLQLIALGLSNREIAEKLVVAISTVKTHINNIYRKLDVSKRTQAVARARELNLL